MPTKTKAEATVLIGADLNDGMRTLVLQCPRCATLCRYARRAPAWTAREVKDNAQHFMSTHKCEESA